MIQYQVQFSATFSFLHTFELVMWLLSLHGNTYRRAKLQVLTYVLGFNCEIQKMDPKRNIRQLQAAKSVADNLRK